MTNYEDVIREAALKNRASVCEDDVLMVVVTVMNRIVDDQIATLTAALEGHRDECDRIALGWRQNANNRANQILNAALDAARKAMAKGMNEGGSKIIGMVREETKNALSAMAAQSAGLDKAVRDYKRFMFWMLAGNCGVMLVALAIAAFR